MHLMTSFGLHNLNYYLHVIPPTSSHNLTPDYTLHPSHLTVELIEIVHASHLPTTSPSIFNSSPPTRVSTRVKKAPSYLADYHCSTVTIG